MEKTGSLSGRIGNRIVNAPSAGKRRFNLVTNELTYSGVYALAKQEDRAMSDVIEEFITTGLARRAGELVQEGGTPHLERTLVKRLEQLEERITAELWTAVRGELRSNLAADLAPLVARLVREDEKRGDNRLAALLIKAIREAGLTRRMVYELLVEEIGDKEAERAFRVIEEQTGKDLARPVMKGREGTS